MPNLTGVTKYFPTAQEDFITTLSGTVASGATSVPLQSVTGYANGDTVCFVVDPSNSKKQVFTGTMDTGGSQVTGVKWTEGVNTTHNTGATVVDYVTATDMAMSTKGILVSHTQDGALRSTAVQTALGITGNPTAGWTPLGFVPLGTVYNGNRSYTCTFSGTDLTGTLSPGMRLLITRGVVAPNLCTSLNGSTQYYSKSSPNKLTFTDDFVVSAWVKLSSYNGAVNVIASRYNGTSGWDFSTNASGQLNMAGYNAGAANFSQMTSYQSVPLNKWVHVTGQLDMSTFTATTTTSYFMIDGVDVPATLSRGGTNPTALIQAGNLEIGGRNAGLLPFTGKIAQVAIFNAKVAQGNIRAIISSGLFGTETSLASAYSFNNSIADLNTTTPNDLTANGSAVATNTDSPFAQAATAGLLEYGIVQSVSFSTNTTLVVQVPEGSAIPTRISEIASIAYSQMRVPFNLPSQRSKWQVRTEYIVSESVTIGANNTFYASNFKLNIPIGSWSVTVDGEATQNSSVSGNRSFFGALASSTPTSIAGALFAAGTLAISRFVTFSSTSGFGNFHGSFNFDLSSAITYTVYGAIDSASGAETYGVSGNNNPGYLVAENGYL